MVGAVGIMLCLEAEGTATRILHAFLAHETAIEEVAGIELQTGLVGEHLHLDACVGVVKRAEALGDVALCVEYPVVVVAVPVHYLLAALIVNAVADGGRCTEIKRRALHIEHLASDGDIGINSGELVGVKGKHLVKAVLGAVATEVEVAVVGEVEDRSLVGGGLILDLQCVIVGEGVGYLHLNVAGIAVLAVRTLGGELYVLLIELVGLPDTVVESDGAAAVQAVGAIVDRELVALAVKGELPLGDTVAVATDEGTEVAALCTVLLVVGDVVMAEAYVAQCVLLVGHHDADDAAAEVGEAYLHAVLIGQDIECCAVGLEVGRVKARLGELRCGLLGA